MSEVGSGTGGRFCAVKQGHDLGPPLGVPWDDS